MTISARCLGKQIPRSCENVERIGMLVVKKTGESSYSVHKINGLSANGPIGTYHDAGLDDTVFALPVHNMTTLISLKDLLVNREGHETEGTDVTGTASGEKRAAARLSSHSVGNTFFTPDTVDLSVSSGANDGLTVVREGGVWSFRHEDSSFCLVKEDAFDGIAVVSALDVDGVKAALDERGQLFVDGTFPGSNHKFTADPLNPQYQNVKTVMGSYGSLFFIQEIDGTDSLMAMGNNTGNKCGVSVNGEIPEVLLTATKVDVSRAAVDAEAYTKMRQELASIQEQIREIRETRFPDLERPHFSPEKPMLPGDSTATRMIKLVKNTEKKAVQDMYDQINDEGKKEFEAGRAKMLAPLEEQETKLMDAIQTIQHGNIHGTSPDTITKVSSGKSHTMFLDENQRLFSAGNNSKGQLGRSGAPTNQIHLVKDGVADCLALDDYTILLLTNGTVEFLGNHNLGAAFEAEAPDLSSLYGILPISETDCALVFRQVFGGCPKPVSGVCEPQIALEFGTTANEKVIRLVSKDAARALFEYSPAFMAALEGGITKEFVLNTFEASVADDICRLVCGGVYPKASKNVISLYIALANFGFEDTIGGPSNFRARCGDICFALLNNSHDREYSAECAIEFCVKIYGSVQNCRSNSFVTRLLDFVGMHWLQVFSSRGFNAQQALIEQPVLLRWITKAIAVFESNKPNALSRVTELQIPFNGGSPSLFTSEPQYMAEMKFNGDGVLDPTWSNGWVKARELEPGTDPRKERLYFHLEKNVERNPDNTNNELIRKKIETIRNEQGASEIPELDLNNQELQLATHFVTYDTLFRHDGKQGLGGLQTFAKGDAEEALVNLYQVYTEWSFHGILDELKHVVRCVLNKDCIKRVADEAITKKCKEISNICFEYIMSCWVGLVVDEKIADLRDPSIYYQILSTAAQKYMTKGSKAGVVHHRDSSSTESSPVKKAPRRAEA